LKKENIVFIVLILIIFAGYIFYKVYPQFKTEPSSPVVKMDNDKALKIVEEVMNRYYTEVNYGNYSLYCGDSEDAGEDNYRKSVSFTTLEELKNHLREYISDELVEKYTSYESSSIDSAYYDEQVEEYVERDGSLYCHVPSRGYILFNKASYTVTSFDDSSISFGANVEGSSTGDVITYNGKGTISLKDKKYILTSYEEETNQSIDDNQATSVVEEIMNRYYEELFHLHSALYCGEVDSSDTLEGEEWSVIGDYVSSKTYSSESELKSYLNTYIKNDLIEEMTTEKDFPEVRSYIEKDNKLYCFRAPRGVLSFSEATYEITDFNKSEITGIAEAKALAPGDEVNIKAHFAIEADSSNWRLAKYSEE